MTKQATETIHYRSLQCVMGFTALQLSEMQGSMRLGHSSYKQNINQDLLEISEAALN